MLPCTRVWQCDRGCGEYFKVPAEANSVLQASRWNANLRKHLEKDVCNSGRRAGAKHQAAIKVLLDTRKAELLQWDHHRAYSEVTTYKRSKGKGEKELVSGFLKIINVLCIFGVV